MVIVQLDSITYNELGDPHALASVEGRPDLKGLQSWQDQTQLGEKHSLNCCQKTADNLAKPTEAHLWDQSSEAGNQCNAHPQNLIQNWKAILFCFLEHN